MRYRFDDLGWYQFEWLVQSLLKAELGLGIESWTSSRGDRGRDAYFDGQLAFPTKAATEGPFVFQVKFVENASASGSNPVPVLLSAVRKELKRIVTRQKGPSGWETPAHYCLLTNVPLDPSTREEVKSLFALDLPTTKVTSLGAGDVADMVDAQPTLRRSFPQLLSLRDLNALLDEAVSRELIERSRAAIDASREVVRVFVPTTAYERTWSTLRTNHFAVLYGPPEMGKTAIAWMVALAQLSNGWDSFLCQSPSEFFRLYKEDRSQVFVADDAFGRTEDDPAATLQWEKDLGHVVSRLDQKHWLILTSRRHLLERARQAMDVRGPAVQFPKPADILIDAAKLSRTDKALMLYRHARQGTRDDASLTIVRENAVQIVDHTSFTPERIRRFIQDRLPELSVQPEPIGEEELQAEIAEAIRNPTRGMRLAFKALAEPYKWFLIGLLEAGYSGKVETLKNYYEAHCPASIRMPFEDIHDQLLEAFVRNWYGSHLTWVHPSCRDLVIDELVEDQNLRHRFLSTASLKGLQLAFSVMGGAEGGRNLPLMVDESGWTLAEGRVKELVQTLDPDEAAQLLTSIEASLGMESDAVTTDRLNRILRVACDSIRQVWDAKQVEFDSKALGAFTTASLRLDPFPALPSARASWRAASLAFESDLTVVTSDEPYDTESLEEWIESLREWIALADEIRKSEPRLLLQDGFPESHSTQIESCLRIAESELSTTSILDEPSEMREEASRFRRVANALRSLGGLARDYAPKTSDLADRLDRMAGTLEERANATEDFPEDDSHLERDDDFDIRLIFSDL